MRSVSLSPPLTLSSLWGRGPFFFSMLAFEDLNNKTDGVHDDILPDTYLRPSVRSPNTGFYYGSRYARDLLRIDGGKGIIANIGPSNSIPLRGAAPTYQEAGNIPLIGYNERSSAVGNSIVYPNILRPVPPIYYDGYAIASLISQYFLWDKVTVFSDSTENGRASSRLFQDYAKLFGIDILSYHPLDRTLPDFTTDLQRAKSRGAKIFVLFLDVTIGSQLLQQGYEAKLFQFDDQIIGGEDMALGSSWQAAGVDLEMFAPLLKGFITVKYRPYAPPSQSKTRFLQKWINHRPTNGAVDSTGAVTCDNSTDFYGAAYLYQFYPSDDQSQRPICSGVNFTSYKDHPNLEHELDSLMYAYDATIAVARGLHHLVYDQQRIPDPSPSALLTYLQHKTSFTGLTGKLDFMNGMDDFNLGGRKSGIVYDIINFRPPSLVNSTHPSQVTWSEVFPTLLSWHSEDGFTPCEGVSRYVHGNPCFDFLFHTKKNTVPVDSPLPSLETMSPVSLTLLRVIAIVGLFCVCAVAVVTFAFRRRRLVRMSQPIMTYFILAGLLTAYVRIILTTVKTTQGSCIARIWLDHVGFQLIFATLLVRSWRVYAVTSSLKRTKVGEKKSSLIILGCLAVDCCLLLTVTVQAVSVKEVTITDTQLENTTQLACSYENRIPLVILYTCDAFVLLSALRFCYLIRKVSATICNPAILIEGLSQN
jgi:ABC-type branched-subunit amino acid transport system substrate-binding protein